ncbi:MAG: hypothetical protein KGD64_03315 [Candidatus Heimdallarchaeota archaeon]|nr:hypothetical protein [Candidatus Heimdallarchaeota archaeon]
MIAEKMETKVWVFLHRYGKVDQLCDEIDVIKTFIVSDETQKYAVFIFDWKKRVGTNIIIKTEERLGDLDCDGAIIIAHRFSSTASAMVEHINK